MAELAGHHNITTYAVHRLAEVHGPDAVGFALTVWARRLSDEATELARYAVTREPVEPLHDAHVQEWKRHQAGADHA